MSKVLILVEGQTEETFVREVLAPYLQQRGVIAITTLATTKRVKTGPHFKGGLVSYGKARNDIRNLLRDTSAVMVTTMLDLYGLPRDFPGLATLPKGSCFQKASHLERAFQRDINHRRFRPYLAIHEFEALLFVEPEQIARRFSDTTAESKLQAVRDRFPSPEEIDDERPPSKRIVEVLPAYRKALHGPLISQEIGLDRMRKQCAHFSEWISDLEALCQE